FVTHRKPPFRIHSHHQGHLGLPLVLVAQPGLLVGRALKKTKPAHMVLSYLRRHLLNVISTLVRVRSYHEKLTYLFLQTHTAKHRVHPLRLRLPWRPHHLLLPPELRHKDDCQHGEQTHFRFHTLRIHSTTAFYNSQDRAPQPFAKPPYPPLCDPPASKPHPYYTS